MVAGEDHVRLVGVPLDGLVHVRRPRVGVAHLCAAQRVEVVQGVRAVLRHAERAQLREVEVELGRRLGAGRELELDLDAVHGERLAGPCHGVGRLDEGDRALGRHLAEAGVDLALLVLGQQGAVHVRGAPRHGVAGVDVLADGRLDEALRRDDLTAAGGDVVQAGDALDAAPVVDVAVRVDDGDDRPPRDVLVDELERRGGDLGRDQRVDDDPARVALDEADHREVHAAHLVDAVGDLEEAVQHVEPRLAPEARIDGRRRFLGVEEGVPGQVPCRLAVGPDDGRRLEPGDEAARGVLEVLLVGPVEATLLQDRLLRRGGVCCRVTTLVHGTTPCRGWGHGHGCVGFYPPRPPASRPTASPIRTGSRCRASTQQ